MELFSIRIQRTFQLVSTRIYALVGNVIHFLIEKDTVQAFELVIQIFTVFR